MTYLPRPDRLSNRPKRSRRPRPTRRHRRQRARLALAEQLLAKIIDNADRIGQGIVHPRHIDVGGSVFLLVTLAPKDFAALCGFGAERDDLEESGDIEPSLEGNALDLESDGNCDDEDSHDAELTVEDTGEDDNENEPEYMSIVGGIGA